MRQQSKKLSNKEIIIELQRISKSLNKNTLTTLDVNNKSAIISASTIRTRFGSFENGLEKANLILNKKRRRYSILDYYENLLNVWTFYGRQPKYSEMDLPPSRITSGAYERKWGKWSNALINFIDYVNKDINIKEDITDENSFTDKNKNFKKSYLKENKNISVSLRYKILLRDNFKCCLCGRSPATDLKCELHIDHIIPSSKGGETIPENLQTTCKECNIGKSNIL